MGFPVEVYGSYGDEKTAQSTKIGTLPLGTRMVLPDGRIFRHAKAGGTALTVGSLVMTEDTVDDHDTNRFAGVSAGTAATSITLTLGGTTAVTEDQYEDGYLYINDEAGEGYIHRIKSNNSAATGADCRFDLEDGDVVQVAMSADTTECGLRVNPYKNVLALDLSALVGQILGLPPIAVTANYYFWCQTRGPAMAVIDGSHTLGEPVHASSAVAGAVEPFAASSAQTWAQTRAIGWCLAVQGSTDKGPIYLDLE